MALSTSCSSSSSSSPPSGDGGRGGLDEAAATHRRARCVAARRGRGAGKERKDEVRFPASVVAAGDGVGGSGGSDGKVAAIFTVYWPEQRTAREVREQVERGDGTAAPESWCCVVEIFLPWWLCPARC
jgi:hypothetical protein